MIAPAVTAAVRAALRSEDRVAGGSADGRRISVPADTTEATIPIPEVEGFAVYGPSDDCTSDGSEVWDLIKDSGFSDTGLAPLVLLWVGRTVDTPPSEGQCVRAANANGRLGHTGVGGNRRSVIDARRSRMGTRFTCKACHAPLPQRGARCRVCGRAAVYDPKTERQERELVLGITLTVAAIVFAIFLAVAIMHVRPNL